MPRIPIAEFTIVGTLITAALAVPHWALPISDGFKQRRVENFARMVSGSPNSQGAVSELFEHDDPRHANDPMFSERRARERAELTRNGNYLPP